MTSPFRPGPKSHLQHYRLVAGGGLLLFGVSAYFGIRAAWQAAFGGAESPAQHQARRTA